MSGTVEELQTEPSYTIELWDDNCWKWKTIEHCTTYMQARRNLDRAIRRTPRYKFRVVKHQEVMYYEPGEDTTPKPIPAFEHKP
jgi:hypothetical protein